jgi:DNA-directed RNA polymerase subunit M/transcription elongation factor TFIIS
MDKICPKCGNTMKFQEDVDSAYWMECPLCHHTCKAEKENISKGC